MAFGTKQTTDKPLTELKVTKVFDAMGPFY